MDVIRILSTCIDYQESLIRFHDLLGLEELLDGPLARSSRAIMDIPGSDLVEIPFDWLYEKTIQLGVASVFTDPQKINRFIKQNRGEFSPEELKAATHWSEHPFKWAFYSLVEHHGEQLFTICDELTQTRYLLYAPPINDILVKNPGRSFRFLSLLFDSNDCQQVLGPTFATEFTKQDIEFFCKTLDAKGFTAGGLTMVMNNHLVDFCRLEILSPTSPQSLDPQRGTTFYWKELHLPGINTIPLPGEWTITTTTHQAQSLDKCAIQKIDTGILEQSPVPAPLLDGKTLAEFLNEVEAELEMETSSPVLFINKTTQRVGINSLSLSRFKLLLHLLSIACARPDLASAQPDYALSASFVQTMDEIPEISCPWDDFFAAFHDVPTTDPSEVAAPTRKFTPIDNDIPPRLELSAEDQAFELGLVQAAGFRLQTFNQQVNECPLYYAYDDKNSLQIFHTLTNGSYSSEVEEGELSYYFADLFEAEFGLKHGLQIMHIFYVMLLLTKEKKTLVRIFALEILRAYHHTLLTELDTDVEGFIGLFSRFVYRKLVKRAFVSVESRPTKDQITQAMYSIAPSEFFLHFVEPHDLEQENEDEFNIDDFIEDDFSEDDFDIDDSDIDDISDADFVIDEEDLS